MTYSPNNKEQTDQKAVMSDDLTTYSCFCYKKKKGETDMSEELQSMVTDHRTIQ